jgi:two-component system, OmpR family, sensor histidine kinase KdpD
MLDRVIRNAGKGWSTRRLGELVGWQGASGQVIPILASLGFVAGVTVFLFAARGVLDLDHAAFGYLMPVIVAALRWGVIPAAVSALAGVAATAFFFYPPIYDLRVYHPAHIADLLLFVLVAIVTGHLANRVRVHVKTARQQEEEIKALYFFSRRLAVASGPTDIYVAIQDHLSAITGCSVVFFAADAGRPSPAVPPQWADVPAAVQRAVAEIFDGKAVGEDASLVDEMTGATWLIRTLAQRNSPVGILAIELRHVSPDGLEAIRPRVDAALGEASATLERIDVAHAIGEARVRSEGETLREALMGSVSHGLRTPLASILGSASILVQAPAVAREPRLASLAEIIRDEAERLNDDIQRLLDASKISSAGVQPHAAWAEVADVVNAALACQRRSLAAHKISVHLTDDLPLLNVDPLLIEQALNQVLNNAAKYSPTGSKIVIEAESRGGDIRIAVGDEGVGLLPEERDHMFERFYRGPRTLEGTTGSGLGLWIARAFVLACGGRMEAASEGVGRGSTIAVVLPQVDEAIACPELGAE